MNILSQQIMSENEEGDEDQELLVKTKPKTKRPPPYKVCPLYTSNAANDLTSQSSEVRLL